MRHPARWGRLIGAVLIVVLVVPAAAAMAGSDELGKIRAATAKYHRTEVALANGYDLMPPLDGCIAHPTDGAMGYHYFNQELIADIGVDPLQPEAMVYAPGPNGQLQLDAVEWIVPIEAWHDAGNVGPPSVNGVDMHILNPATGWYILHAWVWNHNPSGMWVDWNPTVVCP